MRLQLGQTAHNARCRPNVSGRRARQGTSRHRSSSSTGEPRPGFHHRYRSLVGRIGKNMTVIAVAREVAGFVTAPAQFGRETT